MATLRAPRASTPLKAPSTISASDCSRHGGLTTTGEAAIWIRGGDHHFEAERLADAAPLHGPGECVGAVAALDRVPRHIGAGRPFAERRCETGGEACEIVWLLVGRVEEDVGGT